MEVRVALGCRVAQWQAVTGLHSARVVDRRRADCSAEAAALPAEQAVHC